MSKHTAGPWKQCPEDPCRIEGSEAGSHDFPVCWVDRNPISGEHPANANLIAAAPELLEACKQMLPILAGAIMHGMPITEEVASARNTAVAAIAKAEGEG